MAEQDFDIKIRTTADTAGVKQTEAELKRLQSEVEKQGAQAGANIGRLLAPFLSGFSAFKFVDQLNVVAERLKQTSEELAKQGEQITENTIRYQELAKGARDEGDVIKIASLALRDVEAAQKRIIATQQEELGWWDKLTDAIYHQVGVAAAAGGAEQDRFRIAKQALELKMEGQRQLAEMARQELVGAIRSSELQKAAFEKLKAEPLSQAIDETNAKLREQEAILRSIDYTQFPKSWIEAAKNLERTKNDLAAFSKLQEKAATQGFKEVKGADPQVQRILMNEQAARTAREEGRERDADMFQASAEAFKRGATPQQLQQAGALEKLIETNNILRELLGQWK